MELAPRTSGGVEALRGLAEVSEINGDTSGAENCYRKWIGWLPSDPTPYLSLQRLYRKLGRTERAREVLREAVRVAPDNPAVKQALRQQD